MLGGDFPSLTLTQPMRTLYDILGVSPDADQSKVKAAYKRRSKETFLQILNKHLHPGKITSTKSLLKAVREDLEDARDRAKDQLIEIKGQIGTYEAQLGRYKMVPNPATMEAYGENLIESSITAAINSCKGAIAVGEAELQSIESALIHCLRYADPREGEGDKFPDHFVFLKARNAGRSAEMRRAMEELQRRGGF